MTQHNSPFSTKAAMTPIDWPWDHLPVEVSQSLELSMAEQFDVGPVYLLIDPMLGPLEQLPPHLERYPIPGDGLGCWRRPKIDPPGMRTKTWTT